MTTKKLTTTMKKRYNQVREQFTPEQIATMNYENMAKKLNRRVPRKLKEKLAILAAISKT